MFSCAFYVMQILHVFFVSFFNVYFYVMLQVLFILTLVCAFAVSMNFHLFPNDYYFFLVIACFVILKLFVVFIDW